MVTTQTSLPARREPVKAYDVVVLKVDAIERRVLGGMISRSAEMRSQRVSCLRARPRSDTSDWSEKSDCQKQIRGRETEMER